MTVINNNIKALIARQTLPATERSSTGTSASQLHTEQMNNNKLADPSGSIPYVPASASTSVQMEISAASGITDLLIRLRELALQALIAIRPELNLEATEHNRSETADSPLLTLQASCSALVYQIDHLHSSLTVQISSANIDQEQSHGNSIQTTQYAQSTSDLARMQIEQHAGKALLAQANQRPAFVMALLH